MLHWDVPDYDHEDECHRPRARETVLALAARDSREPQDGGNTGQDPFD